MLGTNAQTGKALQGIEHLRQSLRVLLTTPKGTRIHRREYGSDVLDLIDAPMNRATLLAIYAATIEAINTWEPRLRAKSVSASSAEPGRIVLDVVGEYLPNGQTVTISGVVVS